MAKAGDPTAMRLCIERILPAPRSRPIQIDLPEIKAPSDLVAAVNAMFAAVSAGEISPAEGADLATMVGAQRVAIEMAGFNERLKQLEARRGLRVV
jgi:hypothetical protein